MNNPNEINSAMEPTQEMVQSESKAWIPVVFAMVLIIAVVLASLITFSFTINNFLPEPEKDITDFDILTDVMNQNANFTPEYEAMHEAALKAFVGASGDKYTAYYTDEEYAAIQAENEGRYIGIGVTVEEASVVYEGETITVLKIVRIAKDSPAMRSDMSVGDYIYSINVDGVTKYVNEIGYDASSKLIRGEAGSAVTLSYLIETEEGYEKKIVGLIREVVETVSVEYHLSDLDSTIGIVRIHTFDLTTPEQLCNAMDALIAQGASNFVFDLRNNGGGLLKSVVACSSYFVKSGDLLLTKEGQTKTESIYAVYFSYADGKSVLAEDIGKYRDYNFATLVNGNTASAAELFAAVLRDYELAGMVGTQTFGKGSLQDYIPLSSYGMDGVLKLTTNFYYPPCGEGYHGIGLTPDIVIPLEEGVDIDTVGDWDDNQLLCAVGMLLQPTVEHPIETEQDSNN